MTSDEKTKVVFKLNPRKWHGHSTEALWAEKLGRGRYRILNAPFFAKGISYADVVSAKKNSRGQLAFDEVAKRGGFSSIHLVAKASKESTKAFTTLFSALKKLGIEYERGDWGDVVAFALNVPPETDIGRVYAILEKGRLTNLWDWEQGYDGHPEA
jgi:hypothetical protein